MADLVRSLPAPQREYVVWQDPDKSLRKAPTPKSRAPPYGRRRGFVPRSIADFGDGGAFPEIHVAQYPLGMGTKEDKAAQQKGGVVALEVGEDGSVRYDAIVKQGANKNRIVQTSLKDTKGRAVGDDEGLELPTEEEVQETAQRTQQALSVILDGKVNSSKPTHIPEQCDPNQQKATFVRYTPNPNAPGYTATAAQRIVKLVDQQVDPMEPPKHKHTKVPRGPPSPPAPVLHSPPRKVTVHDQQSWKIPPCVSNWKNARGYTIPLDKRLAADGRGLQEQTVNNNFATLVRSRRPFPTVSELQGRVDGVFTVPRRLDVVDAAARESTRLAWESRPCRDGVVPTQAEALYIAERSARDEVRARAEVRQANALRDKEAQEARLRDLAAQAREERNNLQASRGAPRNDGAAAFFDGDDQLLEEEDAGRREREQVRIERKRERERQMRLDNAKGDMKRSRLERERDRDVSEKVALGLLKGSAKLTGEAQFDKRLFNQSSGMDQGFGADDDYNVYSKPLLDREDAAAIYRPRKADDGPSADDQYAALTSSSKFAAPERGFAGTEGGARPRDGPVQFEADAPSDPFGLDKFLTDVKNKKS